MSDLNESRRETNNWIKVLLVLLLLLAAATIYYVVLYPESVLNIGTPASSETTAHLVINEVSASSSDYPSALDGENYDWIELYNPTDRDIDLSKYYLSDKSDAPLKYNLPEVTLAAKAYIVIYASGKDVYEGNEIHANFKISSEGETISLSKSESVISTLTVPEINSDFTYGIGEDGTEGYLYPATPNQANGASYPTEDDYFNFICTPNGIYINEYMSSGQNVIYDEDGVFSDWVEIINTTDEDVSLAGYCLTDDPHKPYRYVLPDVTIAGHGTLLIFLDGEDKVGYQYIHANFSISTDDASLNLFDSSHTLVDTVKVVETDERISYGRNKDDINLWQYFSIPTPNQPNIFEGAAEKEALFYDYQKYVRINEVSPISDNQNGVDESDWIELYNNSDQTIDLAGFGLSDDEDDRYKWVFPKGAVIAPNAYLVVFASGTGMTDEAGNYNTNFKLKAGIDDIYLSSNLGYTVDVMPARFVGGGNSIGKSAGGDVFLLKMATPGLQNDEKTYTGYTSSVQFSQPSGTYSDSFTLTLSSPDTTAEIYYTLDGTTPTKSSTLYTEPITINKDAVIRAIAAAPGKLPSEAACHTFVLELTHDLPIVTITSNPENIYGSAGLLSHSDKTQRIPATVEIIETENSGYISFEAEIGLFGNTSLYAPQKSLLIEVDNDYGDDFISYDLFPNDSKNATTFGSFVLRNGGSNEWNRTKMTDGFLMSLARLGLDVDAQGYRPCAVYINGEYYGLLNIREKMNRDYITAKYGFDREGITIVEPSVDGDYRAVQGNAGEFMSLVTFVRDHDLSDSSNYEYVKSQLDIENYIDTILVHVIVGNKDTGNIKFWKPGEDGEKWRAFLFDCDRAAYYPTVNHLAQITNIEGHGSGNLFDTSLLRGLLENKEFSDQFCQRAVELIDTLYSPEFSTAYYNYLADNIAAEMENNLAIWWQYAYNDATPTSDFGSKPKDKARARLFIQDEQNRHRTFLKTRQTYILGFFKSYFNLSDSDIEKMRKENKSENNAPTQIYNQLMASGSLEAAIALANTLDTSHLADSE